MQKQYTYKQYDNTQAIDNCLGAELHVREVDE